MDGGAAEKRQRGCGIRKEVVIGMDCAENAKKRLRVGILIRDLEKLRNWEYRILKGIIERPDLELALFIKDGRKEAKSFQSQLKTLLWTPNILSNVVFALQVKLERFLFKERRTVDVGDIIARVKDTETVYLSPVRTGFLDVFSAEDSERIKAYNLDIILRHEFNIIRGDILSAARYGIWSFHHGDNAINRGGPAGFWEIVNDEPSCGVTLQQLTPELDGGLVIDKAWFNRGWSYVATNNDLLEKSVVLLFKNLDRLLWGEELETTKSLTYYNRLYKKPNLRHMLLYLGRFYAGTFSRVLKRAFPFRRAECWALFFGTGNFLESTLFRIDPLPMPRKVFWADPFLVRRNGQLHVFFENYSYEAKLGKISTGRIVETQVGGYSIVDVQDALDPGYHLSYPQIVEEDGELYLIPEAHMNRRLEIYRCVEFPGKWDLSATAFEGEGIADTTYFCDRNGDRWLFLNKGKKHEAELYIYKIDSLGLSSIIAHKANPVFIDCRKGRNGGTIFEYENEYYRPSQINTHGVYGRGLQISRIKKLTLEEFEDEAIISVEPNFRKGLIGIHHLHQYGSNFIFDACYKKL